MRDGAVGNPFKVGLREEVASQCHTDDAPEPIPETFALFASSEKVTESWGGMKERMRKCDSHPRQESV